MEVEEVDKKRSSEGEKSTKRKMKTAFQLELLEQTYASEPYPSEKTRAELSEKLSLTDRQLQMWFCHRRLKDRKGPPVKRSKKEMIAGSAGEPEDEELMSETGFDQGPGPSVFDSIEPRKTVHTQRTGGDFPVLRYYSPPPPPPARSMAELRIISFIEAQIGEPLREDAPTLGVEFDPLPPGAFGAPLEPAGQPIPGVWSYDSKIYDRHDIKAIKAPHMMSDVEHLFVPNSSCSKRKQGIHVLPPSHSSLRAVHEYQFLPEKPTIRSDSYERGAPSHSYDSPVDAANVRGTSLHVNEVTSYNFESPPPNVLSSHGRHCHSYSSGSKEYGVTPRNLYPIGTDIGLHNTLVTSDKKTSHDQEVSRIERKRKSEEAKIAKEVEAHEKRIRKELEKQDIIRRKREEQMRREMERLGRERKKEEERLMREKQREEEKFRREQRRENERRERFLQKESLRAEKLRQKEELRREKEAARLKAANERATARRIAKESMELIEDERLELMELAASSKGLPSMLSLDCETLMNLDMFRDILPTFPPKSVPLKKPFAVRPWIDSEESVGNLLMVWRFLTTFADVLKIWPFTLDEFVQALHDYEPRLLGEVHISLLKCIIKDIEDVARTPSTGMGVNQNTAANPVGGHPQIVEGAYTWGFDISSWQHHLNPLTWPEILRQFALSAGLGPHIKKRSIERRFFHEDNEGHDGEDIISTLRNGSAAENAFAIMHVKGFSHPRRSRHRLTPGTVKFAAYHVLSLEGSQGLTILEVADKIQKSGLRDLTTSKTPEASIAAALSRDTTLFERTAPSTYCVRAPYRKDPADANAILSAAREKIQTFQNGYSDSEVEKDAEDVDDVEQDEVSDSDGAEEPEVEDDQNVGTPNEGKMIEHELQHNDIGQSCQVGNSEIGSSSFSLKSSKDENMVDAEGQSLKLNVDEKHGSNIDLEDVEIDESISGEPWVQGLVEGEYSDLSVEERLSALISLVGVAIQGNMLRVVLEERMEAANSLKKQMWAEAQLDKRRMKEDYVSKHQYAPFVGIKSEENINETNVEESNQNPLLEHDGKPDDVSPTPPLKQETTVDSNNVQNYNGKSSLGQEFATLDSIQQPPQGYVAEKSRSQMKSLIGQKAEEMYVYRSLPLGQDRRRNRYWLFITSASRNDPGCGRIFFESKDGFWRLIDSEQAFDALLSSLDIRGIRESHLHSVLQKIETSFKEAVKKNLHGANRMDLDREFDSPNSMICVGSSDKSEYSSSFRIELARDEKEKEASYKRYQELQKWIWKECSSTPILCAMRYGQKRSSELVGVCDVCHSSYLCVNNHCSSCHETFDIVHNPDMDFLKHVSECVKWLKVDPYCKLHGSNSFIPSRIEFVKALLALIEASIPAEALQSFWTDSYREVWATKLHSSSSANELLQALTSLEGGIKRDYLHLKFETTNELLGFTVSEILNDSLLYKPLPVLPWIPETTSAVTLRALELDSSICYVPEQKADMDKEKESRELMKLPSSYREMRYFDPTEVPVSQVECYPEEKWSNPVSTSGRKYPQVGGRNLRGRGRGRGGRGSSGGGGRWQSLTTINYSGPKISNENAVNVNRAQARKVRTRGRGTKRGKRTVRNRPRSIVRKTTEPEAEFGRFYTSAGFTKQHFSVGNESDSDNNGPPSTDEFENQTGEYNDIYTDKTLTMMDESDTDEEDDAGDNNIGEMDSDLDNLVDDEEEDGNGDDRGEMDGEEDYEDVGFMNGNEEDTDDGGDEEEVNDDGEGTPSSSEYSDS